MKLGNGPRLFLQVLESRHRPPVVGWKCSGLVVVVVAQGQLRQRHEAKLGRSVSGQQTFVN